MSAVIVLAKRYCPLCGSQLEESYEGKAAGEHKWRTITAADAGMVTEFEWSRSVPNCRIAVEYVGQGRSKERREKFYVPARVCWHCSCAMPEPLCDVTPRAATDVPLFDGQTAAAGGE